MIGLEYHKPEYTILIHINTRSPSISHNTQLPLHHRPGYDVYYIFSNKGSKVFDNLKQTLARS